jgi:hypothetical protein
VHSLRFNAVIPQRFSLHKGTRDPPDPKVQGLWTKVHAQKPEACRRTGSREVIV